MPGNPETTTQRPSGDHYCGRGERRPKTGRAARTNDPLRLPDGLHGNSPQARRWRDLLGFYSAQLGDRLCREDVRALLGSLVSLTLLSERLNDDVARGLRVDPTQIIQVSQSVLRLLGELRLQPVAAEPPPPDLQAHIADRMRAASA